MCSSSKCDLRGPAALGKTSRSGLLVKSGPDGLRDLARDWDSLRARRQGIQRRIEARVGTEVPRGG
jgi:hypothetical protein